jgi:hypothetical protein
MAALDKLNCFREVIKSRSNELVGIVDCNGPIISIFGMQSKDNRERKCYRVPCGI